MPRSLLNIKIVNKKSILICFITRLNIYKETDKVLIEKNIKTAISYKGMLIFLYIYKIFFCCVGEFYLRNIMKRGDVPFYMYAEPFSLLKKYGMKFFTEGSPIPQFLIGTVFTILKSEFLTHLIFTSLSFYGIKVFLDSIPDKKDRYFKILMLIFFLPGFNVWSSVAGKETIVLFAMGIVCAQIVRFFNGEKVKTGILFFIALYLICVIKRQYAPGIIQIVIYIFLRYKIKMSWKTDLLILLGLLVINILIIYIKRAVFSDYSLIVHGYFRSSSRSTRPRFFYEPYDFFRKMPYLMPLAMWGPTLAESKMSKMHLFAFIESSALFSFLGYFLIDSTVSFFRYFKKYYQWFFLFIICTGWLSIAQYIQGVMNAGAAVRYRTNLVLVFSALCYSASIIKKNINSNKL